MKKIKLLLILFAFCFPAVAQDSFIISDIRIEGLEKLDEGTLFNYLPLKIGDEVNDEETKISIKELFKTGFFRNVSLEKEGTTLVVKVQERPSIAGIDISGNDALDTESIQQGLEQSGVVEGRIFQNAVLERVERELQATYLEMGRYSATVETSYEQLERNRVAISIDIVEGRVARIKNINIIGAEQISASDIKDEIQLQDRRGWVPFSRKDQYSKQKLEADLETIRSLYLNQGYHEFQIISSNVEIGPNKQSVFISITIDEGELYSFGETNIEGVEADVIAELTPLLTIEPGKTFSRADVSVSRSALSTFFADKGYAFVEIRPAFETDRSALIVNTVFSVVLNQRVYVRRIDISGNQLTRDQVIRRELRQFESAWYSASAVRRSKSRLQRLGLFETVEIETPIVPGTTDQVDIKVIVKERRSGSVLFSAGYSDEDGVLFGVEFEQRNLFGTDKDLSIAINQSDATDSVVIAYTNPYHTEDGISRGLRYERTKVDSEEVNTAEYVLNDQSLGVVYKIPIAETNSLNFGVEYERIELDAVDATPLPFRTFIEEQPDGDDLVLTLGLSRDTRDDFFFPNSGGTSSVSLEYVLPGSDYEYYKVNLRGLYYLPITDKLTVKGGLDLGIGDGYGDLSELPFFKNYFVGGPRSVRGYEARSLGPREAGDPIGGHTRVLGNVELLLPAFGTAHTTDKRIGLFVDAGMVYGYGYNNLGAAVSKESVDLGELRYSTGVFFNWYSPIGPFSVSYGVPIDEELGDEVEKLQISLGTVFR